MRTICGLGLLVLLITWAGCERQSPNSGQVSPEELERIKAQAREEVIREIEQKKLEEERLKAQLEHEKLKAQIEAERLKAQIEAERLKAQIEEERQRQKE